MATNHLCLHVVDNGMAFFISREYMAMPPERTTVQDRLKLLFLVNHVAISAYNGRIPRCALGYNRPKMALLEGCPVFSMAFNVHRTPSEAESSAKGDKATWQEVGYDGDMFSNGKGRVQEEEWGDIALFPPYQVVLVPIDGANL